MDLFGDGATPRTSSVTRRASVADAWLAASLVGADDPALRDREAARRAGAAERVVPLAWLALTVEQVARDAWGTGVVVRDLDLHVDAPVLVDDDVTVTLTPLGDSAFTARVAVAVDGKARAHGTLAATAEGGDA